MTNDEKPFPIDDGDFALAYAKALEPSNRNYYGRTLDVNAGIDYIRELRGENNFPEEEADAFRKRLLDALELHRERQKPHRFAPPPPEPLNTLGTIEREQRIERAILIHLGNQEVPYPWVESIDIQFRSIPVTAPAHTEMPYAHDDTRPRFSWGHRVLTLNSSRFLERVVRPGLIHVLGEIIIDASHEREYPDSRRWEVIRIGEDGLAEDVAIWPNSAARPRLIRDYE
jgi:hypothetical protein